MILTRFFFYVGEGNSMPLYLHQTKLIIISYHVELEAFAPEDMMNSR